MPLAVIDIIIAIPTLLFFLAYAKSSVSLDTEHVIVGTKAHSAVLQAGRALRETEALSEPELVPEVQKEQVSSRNHNE